jgi:hypothetical protein
MELLSDATRDGRETTLIMCFTAFWSGGDVEVLDRFIEVDRTTESYATVMAKLRRYVELYRYSPRNSVGAGWRAEFDRFPKLIVVLCGAPDPVLVNRRRRLLQLCAQDQVLAKACGLVDPGRVKTVEVSFTTLADLVVRGPFEPIFWQPGLVEPVDLVGERTCQNPASA